MKGIKERCLWFIGYDRMLNSNYSEFMYSENDIVLFEYDKSPNEFVRILRKSKEQVVDVRYTIGKKHVKLYGIDY